VGLETETLRESLREGDTGAIAALQRFLAGGGFPAFAISLVFFYELLLLALLLTPAAETGLGAFAEEFRIWCFGLDPATGRLEWGYVIGMAGPPTLLVAFLALLWWEPLRELRARPATLLASALAAAALVSGLAGCFAALGASPERGELPFPAEALRTALRAPELRLVNQIEEPVDLAEQRGNVVLLTAVYASCPHTCPLILAQAKRVVGALEPTERADLRVIAVTLDPERDSPEVLAQLADLHGLEPPLYNLVTGNREEVERVLDAMGVARRRDPETGVIEHPGLFVLIDRDGSVAYRLTLGDRQERWLGSALRLLLREPPHVG
jgi:protein SCO1/2